MKLIHRYGCEWEIPDEPSIRSHADYILKSNKVIYLSDDQPFNDQDLDIERFFSGIDRDQQSCVVCGAPSYNSVYCDSEPIKCHSRAAKSDPEHVESCNFCFQYGITGKSKFSDELMCEKCKVYYLVGDNGLVCPKCKSVKIP